MTDDAGAPQLGIDYDLDVDSGLRIPRPITCPICRGTKQVVPLDPVAGLECDACDAQGRFKPTPYAMNPERTWKLLCPGCRGSRLRTVTLRDGGEAVRLCRNCNRFGRSDVEHPSEGWRRLFNKVKAVDPNVEVVDTPFPVDEGDEANG